MFKKQLGCLFLIMTVIFVADVGWAKKSAVLKKAAKEKVPIVITASHAEFNSKTNRANYKGNVKVVRGDVTMYSNQLEAFLDKEGKEIDHIVATGDVKILQEGRVITSKKAVYYEAEQKVVLSGDPVSREGKSIIKGSLMIYFFEQERIMVENAVSELHPDEKNKEKKK